MRAVNVFWTLWTLQLVSTLFSVAAACLLGLECLAQTGSTAVMGAVLGAALVGPIYGAPLVGSLVDRLGPQVVARRSCLGAAAVSATLAGVVDDIASRVVALVALVVLSGVCACGISLSLMSSVRSMRPERDLTRAAGVVSLMDSMPLVVAPLIATLIYRTVDVRVFFVADALSFVAALLGMRRVVWPSRDVSASRDVSLSRRQPDPDATGSTFLAHTRAGFRYIAGDVTLRRLQVAFMGLNLCNGVAAAVLVAYLLAVASPATDHPERWVGVAQACGSVGLLGAALVIGRVGGRVRRSTLMIGGLLVSAVGGRVGLAAASTLVMLAGALWLRNVGLQMINIPLTALWQERVPIGLQGRVLGARKLLGQGLYPPALLVGGALGSVVAGRWGRGRWIRRHPGGLRGDGGGGRAPFDGVCRVALCRHTTQRRWVVVDAVTPPLDDRAVRPGSTPCACAVEGAPPGCCGVLAGAWCRRRVLSDSRPGWW